MSQKATAIPEPKPLWLIKWGGGLLTDKREPESLNQSRLDGLAGELVAGSKGAEVPFVLGHGSGSFGHWSARNSFLRDPKPVAGVLGPEQLLAVANTADAASRLHRRVIKSLIAAGAMPYSWLVSSATVEDDGTADGGSCVLLERDVRPVSEALNRGLLPVTMGDVVLSTRFGARIWSTEHVVEAMAAALPGVGYRVERVLWFGNTNGILDEAGGRVDTVDAMRPEEVDGFIGGSDGVDVTGGMRLRFETCCRLARAGVDSWILDGRELQVIRSALSGVRDEGTLVAAGPDGERGTNLNRTTAAEMSG